MDNLFSDLLMVLMLPILAIHITFILKYANMGNAVYDKYEKYIWLSWGIVTAILFVVAMSIKIY